MKLIASEDQTLISTLLTQLYTLNTFTPFQDYPLNRTGSMKSKTRQMAEILG